jgi:hypothetical protein
MALLSEHVVQTNAALADPANRERVRGMHAQGVPLVDMVESLGLGSTLTPELRAIITGLAPDVVEGIRQATLEMLDRGESAMPLDCQVSDADIAGGVEVGVAQSASGQEQIQIRQA